MITNNQGRSGQGEFGVDATADDEETLELQIYDIEIDVSSVIPWPVFMIMKSISADPECDPYYRLLFTRILLSPSVDDIYS